MTNATIGAIADLLDVMGSSKKASPLPGFQVESELRRETWRRQFHDKTEDWLRANDPDYHSGQKRGRKDYGYYGPTEGEWHVGYSDGFGVMMLRQTTVKRVWTQEEDDNLAQLYASGLNVQQCSERIGKPKSSVRRRLIDMGVRRRGRWG